MFTFILTILLNYDNLLVSTRLLNLDIGESLLLENFNKITWILLNNDKNINDKCIKEIK